MKILELYNELVYEFKQENSFLNEARFNASSNEIHDNIFSVIHDDDNLIKRAVQSVSPDYSLIDAISDNAVYEKYCAFLSGRAIVAIVGTYVLLGSETALLVRAGCQTIDPDELELILNSTDTMPFDAELDDAQRALLVFFKGAVDEATVKFAMVVFASDDPDKLVSTCAKFIGEVQSLMTSETPALKIEAEVVEETPPETETKPAETAQDITTHTKTFVDRASSPIPQSDFYRAAMSPLLSSSIWEPPSATSAAATTSSTTAATTCSASASDPSGSLERTASLAPAQLLSFSEGCAGTGWRGLPSTSAATSTSTAATTDSTACDADALLRAILQLDL